MRKKSHCSGTFLVLSVIIVLVNKAYIILRWKFIYDSALISCLVFKVLESYFPDFSVLNSINCCGKNSLGHVSYVTPAEDVGANEIQKFRLRFRIRTFAGQPEPSNPVLE